MRIRSFLPIVVLLAVACTDRGLTTPRGSRALRGVAITPNGTLDENISALLATLPNGLANAGQARWNSVKRKYQAGQIGVAKSQLFTLADWVQKNAPKMTPPNDETGAAAAARLVLYMSLYVYGGPGTTPPDFIPGADDAVGLVTPSAPATVVTPTTHAGVALDAGSVGENTIVVITENPGFYEQCRGPLQTNTEQVCQYPLFYTFNEFPHNRLLKAGRFAVCHVKVGDPRGPDNETIHERFRLAHTLPADPADLTPGSLTGEQYGQIEILPLTTQTFSICADVTYGSTDAIIGMRGALGWLARAVTKAVTPRSLYAIDQGGGGESIEFSDFNVVDPDRNAEVVIEGATVLSKRSNAAAGHATKKIGTP